MEEGEVGKRGREGECRERDGREREGTWEKKGGEGRSYCPGVRRKKWLISGQARGLPSRRKECGGCM